MTDQARNSPPVEVGSSQKLLFELQVEQHHHDEAYHREIARLSLHHRLNHMALHFAKYVGKVAQKNRVDETVPVLVDALIIGLSSANILNIELWDHLQDGSREYPGLLPFGRALALRFADDIRDVSKLTRALAVPAGLFAAACEKIDHLEEISFRNEARSAIARFSALSLAVLATEGVEPTAAVRERLAGVKRKLKLHGRI